MKPVELLEEPGALRQPSGVEREVIERALAALYAPSRRPEERAGAARRSWRFSGRWWAEHPIRTRPRP